MRERDSDGLKDRDGEGREDAFGTEAGNASSIREMEWSGYRESNPGIQLGRLLLYH